MAALYSSNVRNMGHLVRGVAPLEVLAYTTCFIGLYNEAKWSLKLVTII
jgi:hypothetical protein